MEQRELDQWRLKIRAYADEMLESLNTLDKWPETVKEAQRGWIGKSEGARIKFVTCTCAIEIFTTKPETLFGVTFIAVSY